MIVKIQQVDVSVDDTLLITASELTAQLISTHIRGEKEKDPVTPVYLLQVQVEVTKAEHNAIMAAQHG